MTRLRLALFLGLCACGQPAVQAASQPAPAPFPPPATAADIIGIELMHHACIGGGCPQYSFRLRADGTGQYEGESSTPMLGCYEATIPRELYVRLARRLLHSDFFRFIDTLAVWHDAASTTLAIALADGRQRAVTATVGVPEFRELVTEIERAASSLEWHVRSAGQGGRCAA